MDIKKVVFSYLKKTAAEAEKEVERFLKDLLPGTPFQNKAFAVGGYVRDEYLSIIKKDPSIKSKDLDIVVEMEGGAKKLTHYIYDVLSEFNPIPVSTPIKLGKSYPIWEITFKEDITFRGEIYYTKGSIIQFADSMKESFPDPNSRQRNTEFSTIQEDARRRDFTINMLLKDLTNGEIIDLTGVSKKDIENGILRGHPEVSINEIFNFDPLRMIRLIRFQIKYGWNIPRHVLMAVKNNASRINIVSSERIMDELNKIMNMGKLERAIRLMRLTGLLQYILPEVNSLQGIKQPVKYHEEGDVYRHTLMVLKNAKPGIESQLAALLHDIGKPKTQKVLEDNISFYGHANVGAEITEAILRRMRFTNKEIDKITTYVKNHMRVHNIAVNPSEKAIREFIRDVGEEMVDGILDLAEADELGSFPNVIKIPELREKIKQVIKEKPIVRKPILNGDEIMKILKIEKGKKIGEIKDFLISLEDEYLSNNLTLTKEKAEKALLEEWGPNKKPK